MEVEDDPEKGPNLNMMTSPNPVKMEWEFDNLGLRTPTKSNPFQLPHENMDPAFANPDPKILDEVSKKDLLELAKRATKAMKVQVIKVNQQYDDELRKNPQWSA